MNSYTNKLNKYFESNPSDLGSKVNSEKIKNAEKELNVKFSNQYFDFISKYGAAGINEFFVYGFTHLPLMSINNFTIVQKTNFYRNQNWPGIEDWYVISDDGGGNPIGCKPDGSVWLSDHDSNFEEIKLADDFEEFLEKLLEDTLYK